MSRGTAPRTPAPTTPPPGRPAVHAAPKEFDETSHVVSIAPEEREVGVRTKRYFDRTLKRRRPWVIKAGRIDVLKSGACVHTDGLANERITPLLGSVLLTFKRIEDKLPDFSGRSTGLFRNIWGINHSYHQWAVEEAQHSDALALVLERTGQFSQAELDDDYYDNLARTWEPPFPTARQMTLYAAFQEQLTSLNYHALARRATEEDAPTVAEVLTLIAQDEAYHGGGYRAFSRIYADLDLEGTVADALHVARNFRMPAQHLMRNPRRNSIEIVRVGAFSKEMVSQETIYKVLSGLRFVPEADARAAAEAYWKTA